MDKQLKKLKKQFEADIPTSFTEKDKEAVFEKIKNREIKQPKKVFPLFPKVLTSFVVASIVLIVVITINNNPSDFSNSMNDATDTAEKNEMSSLAREEVEMEDKRNDTLIMEESEEEANESNDLDLAQESQESNQIETTIEPSDELMNIYTSYKASLDDNLLQGLDPIDVFKLYYHAQIQGDQEVQYALYLQGEKYGTPDKEAYFNDRNLYENNMEDLKEFYGQLKQLTLFTEVQFATNEEEYALINFEIEDKDWPSSFRLIKDPDTNVWKVQWMPLQ
ncbi:hypothetical protein SAMN05216389_11447 [Oceanobacillus limi]|uniref:Uncharacterized protein n=1 Tax=Oceanobacillus limi TaxID=930131 RepID=A0A1I0F7H5_9BACI|nr:hypothetical protein [Oceanobacillus limi]SET54036.1 hypothetical protein SAMN05216389_11447 [Oceanobacillus limi]